MATKKLLFLLKPTEPYPFGQREGLFITNELAMMMARLYNGSLEMILLRNAYHCGRSNTIGLKALNTWKYSLPQGEIHRVWNPNPYLGEFGFDGSLYAKDVQTILSGFSTIAQCYGSNGVEQEHHEDLFLICEIWILCLKIMHQLIISRFQSDAKCIQEIQPVKEVSPALLSVVQSFLSYYSSFQNRGPKQVCVKLMSEVQSFLSYKFWEFTEKAEESNSSVISESENADSEMLKEGEVYECPNEGSVITLKLIGKHQDGIIFFKKGHDEEELFEFKTDEEQVRKERELFTKEKESWDMNTQEKIEVADKNKEESNVLFKAEKYTRASKRYERGVKCTEYDSTFDEEEKKKAKALKITLNLNNVACKLKLKDYQDAAKLTMKVLEIDGRNVKAMYRRAHAYMEMAELDIKKALEVDPDNKEVPNFNPLREALKNPDEFLLSDSSRFLSQAGLFPIGVSEEDAQKLVEIANEINENLDDARLEDVNSKLLHYLVFEFKAVLSPMAAMFGGIVWQEVVKACSGKLHLLFQFFYFDSVESLPKEPLDTSEFRPQSCLHDAQVSEFGSTLEKKLKDARVFVVGANALGCKFLENLALIGVSCGSQGKLTVTYDDVIEKSNLSRQSLFQNWNIRQAKFTITTTTTAGINLHLKIGALQNRIGPETEQLDSMKIFMESSTFQVDGSVAKDVELTFALSMEFTRFHSPRPPELQFSMILEDK